MRQGENGLVCGPMLKQSIGVHELKCIEWFTGESFNHFSITCCGRSCTCLSKKLLLNLSMSRVPHNQTNALVFREVIMKVKTLLFFVMILFLSVSNLYAESLIFEHYPYKQVAADSSYTEPFVISSAPSNATLTNTEVQFTYIAYGVVQDYVSARVNKGSDPGSSDGASLVAQGDLPEGNEGIYGYISFDNWNGQNVNDTYYVKFATDSGCPFGGPTINVVGRSRYAETINI